MNQSEEMSFNLHKARENARVQVTIDFYFTAYLLKNWRMIFKLVTSVLKY